MQLVPLLGAMAFAAAAVSFVVYILVLARRPQWVRVLNGSGLFFTGAALFPTPVILAQTRDPGARYAELAVGLLILSVAAQSLAALRNRRAWDGVERRRGELDIRT